MFERQRIKVAQASRLPLFKQSRHGWIGQARRLRYFGIRGNKSFFYGQV
jgi:hypothetical protein